MNSLLQMSKVFNTSFKFTDIIICQAFRALSTVELYISFIYLYRTGGRKNNQGYII